MAIIAKVLEGMKIIEKYAKNDEMQDDGFQVTNDQIYCGDYTADRMTEDDLSKMETLGWFCDDESDAWTMLSCDDESDAWTMLI